MSQEPEKEDEKKLDSFSKFIKKKKNRSDHFRWNPEDVEHLGTVKEDASYPLPDSAYVKSNEPIRTVQFSDKELANQSAHRETYKNIHHGTHTLYKGSSHQYFNKILRHTEPETFDSSRDDNHSLPPYHHDGKIRIPNHRALETLHTNPDRRAKEHYIEHYHAMDHITGHHTSEEISLYRGFGRNFPIHHLAAGHEFIDHGYVGTSKYPHLALNNSHFHYTDGSVLFAKNTIAKIRIPAGTKGHLLDHPDHVSPIGGEGEFTLHRGTHFRVMGHSIHDNTHVVHLDVVGQHPKPLVAGKDKIFY